MLSWGRPRRRSPGKELRVELGDQRTSFFIRQNGSHLHMQELTPLSRMLVASRCIVRLNKKPIRDNDSLLAKPLKLQWVLGANAFCKVSVIHVGGILCNSAFVVIRNLEHAG